MLLPIPDARTTPPRWRVPTLVLLGALVAWFAVCYRFALANLGAAEPPAALAAYSDLFWLGRWRMFTDARPLHRDLVAEAGVGGAFTPVDLAAVYPSRWNEGPGYLRDDFVDNPKRLGKLGEDLCRRVDAERIRFTLVEWPKTLGQVDQPRDRATRRELLDLPCGASLRTGR